MEENNKLDSIENSIQTIQNDIVLLKKNDSLQDEKIKKLENKEYCQVSKSSLYFK